MVAAINIRADISGVERLLNSIAAKTPAALAKAVLAGAQFAEGEIKRTLYDETQGRGELARSFHSRFLGWQGGDVSAEAYSDLVYARIQEDGGVIRPKHRKALAVPIRLTVALIMVSLAGLVKSAVGGPLLLLLRALK